MITPEQCRAARGWLDWTQTELARQAKVGLATVALFEKGKRLPSMTIRVALAKAIEDAGLGLLSIPGGPTGIAVRRPKVAEG